MQSKEKAFLEKFCEKESSSLIGFENFGAAGFSIIVRLGWYYPQQSKGDQMSTHQIPPIKYFRPPQSLTLPYCCLK